MKSDKTNAMRLLERQKLPYLPHEFPAGEGITHAELSEAIGVPLERIYKTLVTVGRSGEHYVFVVPLERELELKKAARVSGEKSIEMVKSKELLPLTGYVHGGCSPVGMKKQFKTFVDLSAKAFDTVSVSGGRRGLQMELDPNALSAAFGFDFADVATD